MEETQEQVVVKIKHSTYNKEWYEASGDYMVKCLKDRCASLNKKQYGTKVQTGSYGLRFD